MTAAVIPSLVVELVPIDRLHPDPANPRRISEDELESLTRSMRQWGVVQPVLARREDSVVIGGHQRLVAARRVGLTEIPVIWLDITQEQARLLNLALNRISGSWDEQLLARLLADLGTVPDMDLALSGVGAGGVRRRRRSHGPSPVTSGCSESTGCCVAMRPKPQPCPGCSTVRSQP